METFSSCSGSKKEVLLSSPFGGIPRNWKHLGEPPNLGINGIVPPSGGSLEIGNFNYGVPLTAVLQMVPPSGGSLEIGNEGTQDPILVSHRSPFGGIPRNWKH